MWTLDSITVSDNYFVLWPSSIYSFFSVIIILFQGCVFVLPFLHYLAHLWYIYRCPVGCWVLFVCTNCFLWFLNLEALFQISTLRDAFLKRSGVPVDHRRYFISVEVCLTLGTAFQLFFCFSSFLLTLPHLLLHGAYFSLSNNTSHTHLTWQIINANDTFWLWLVLISIMSSNLLCFPKVFYWTFDTCFAFLKCEYSMYLGKRKWPSSCMVELCVYLRLW